MFVYSTMRYMAYRDLWIDLVGHDSPPTILLVEIRIFVNAATQDAFSTATATVEIACCVIPASSTPGGGPGRADEGLPFKHIAETLEGGAGRPSGRESQEAVSRALAREVGVLWSSSRCDRPRTLRVWVGGWGVGGGGRSPPARPCLGTQAEPTLLLRRSRFRTPFVSACHHLEKLAPRSCTLY